MTAGDLHPEAEARRAEPAIRVAFITTGLEVGGAETALVRLLGAMRRDAITPVVISLSGRGVLADELQHIGVPVRFLRLDRPFAAVCEFRHLVRLLRSIRPDLIQTWMYDADLIGAAANRFGPRVPVVWGIRNGSLDRSHSKFRTRAVRSACAALSSRMPEVIVSCASSAADIHRGLGYCAPKLRVIPNGVNTELFRRQPELRAAIRREWGITEQTPVIGCVARFDRQKDHETFLRAASLLLGDVPDARFVLSGAGCVEGNGQLMAWIERFGLERQMTLLGLRRDVPALMNAFDVHTLSSSYGEAFPNVVAESMACEVPNVVTDVGDAAVIVGASGVVVPPEDAPALAAGWRRILTLGAGGITALGENARKRVLERFSLEQAVNAYLSLYRSLAPAGRP